MKHLACKSFSLPSTLTMLCLALLLSSVTLAAGDSEEGKQREDAIRAVLAKIEGVDKQLETFNADFEKLQATGEDIIRKTVLIDKRGDALVVRFKAIKERDVQYGKDVDTHAARCPRETTDKSLADSCNKDAEELRRRQAGLKNDLTTWTTDKDTLLSDVNALDGEKAELKRQLDHNIFSRRALEESKLRLQEELKRLGKEVSECAKLLKGPVSCERLKHECGNVQFDGADKNLKDSQGTPCN